jgi:hypothetical protein
MEVERRFNPTPVPVERRMHERIAILEVKVDNHSALIERTHDLTNKIVEKLDRHTEEEAARDRLLQDNLMQVTMAVSNLSMNVSDTNETLKAIAGIATDSKDKWLKWDAAIGAIIRIAGILVISISALWAIYDFNTDHPEILNSFGSKNVQVVK